MNQPETTPTRFYKYLPWNTGSWKVISDGTLKYTHSSEFNDPFDCEPYYAEIDFDRIKKGRPEFLRQVSMEMGMSASDYLQNKHKLVQRLRRGVQSGEYHRKMMANTGVFSLSTNPIDILMWSHYASFHEGFVVEFRVELDGENTPNINNLEDLIPLQVTYDENRPIVDLSLEPERGDVIKVVTTKSPHWRYEQEWRHIEYMRGPGIHTYSVKKHLVGVISGAKADSYRVETLRGLLKDAEEKFGVTLSFHQAILREKTYEVFIPDHHTSRPENISP